MKFAKAVFWVAGVWGVLVLAPLYFMAQTIGKQTPPAITHPEYFYGFVGLGLAWQIAFFVIATDPVRFRPMMIPSVLEKWTFIAALAVLYFNGLVRPTQLFFGAADLLLSLLFLAAFAKTSSSREGKP